ncbi:MAG: hypothetical protein KC468_31565 [Myxococcales bacterium]|nr:hypothetical protein [Myxococcales bacterium]
MQEQDRLEMQLAGIQKAILWSGSALVFGALVGLGIGVRFGREIERLARERRREEQR